MQRLQVLEIGAAEHNVVVEPVKLGHCCEFRTRVIAQGVEEESDATIRQGSAVEARSSRQSQMSAIFCWEGSVMDR
jgi:hypothetical protein